MAPSLVCSICPNQTIIHRNLHYLRNFVEIHQLNLEIEQQAMRLLGLCFHLLPLIKIFISRLNPYSSFQSLPLSHQSLKAQKNFFSIV